MKPQPQIPLASLFSPEASSLNLQSADRDAVLAELVGLVPQLADQPAGRETLLRALREREDLCSTGVGDGIALPHARNALVGLVDRPVIAFGRHATGIPFGAVDAQPARLFFLLVAPTVTQHLSVQARLGRVLRSPSVRKKLLEAQKVETLLKVIRDAEAKL